MEHSHGDHCGHEISWSVAGARQNNGLACLELLCNILCEICNALSCVEARWVYADCSASTSVHFFWLREVTKARMHHALQELVVQHARWEGGFVGLTMVMDICAMWATAGTVGRAWKVWRPLFRCRTRLSASTCTRSDICLRWSPKRSDNTRGLEKIWSHRKRYRTAKAKVA